MNENQLLYITDRFLCSKLFKYLFYYTTVVIRLAVNVLFSYYPNN